MHEEPGDGSVAVTALSSSGLREDQIRVIVNSVPGGANNIEGVYPLTPLQEGMLFHRLASDRNDTYVLSILFELQSRSQVKELRDAVQWVIDRHGSLRTAVLWEGVPQALQVIHRAAKLPMEEIDLAMDRDLEAQIVDLMNPGYCRIDVARAPLVRLQVPAEPDSGKCFAILRVHHIICDHRSLQFFVEEIVARLRGEESILPAPGPFGDLVAQTMAPFGPSDPEEFFRAKLRDFDGPSAPFGLVDLHGDASATREARLALGPDIALRFRAESKRLGVSTARLFHAAWAIVAAGTSGRDDIVFGTVLSLGGHEGIATGRTLGMAVNTLPLRVRVHGLDARGLVASVDRELSELRRFRNTPLTTAQRGSSVATAAPLFTSLLNCRRNASSLLVDRDSGPAIRVRACGEASTNYPIALIADDLSDAFSLIAQTDPRIDPDRVLNYFRGALVALVEALESAPQTEALSLSILPAAERRQLLEAFSAAQISHPYPQRRLIHELFEEQVERSPDELAVISGGEHLTYAQLNRRANQLARHLRSMGVKADALVGICAERSLEMVVGWLAVLKAGGAYVPLDPSYPVERLDYMLTDAAPLVVLTQTNLKEKLPKTSAKTLALDGDWYRIAGRESGNLDSAGLLSTHLAYVIYTSGSTGQPKGVMIDHASVLNLYDGLEQFYRRAGGCVRVALNASFNFDASVQQLTQLIAGRALILVPKEVRQDPTLLLKFLEDHRIEAIDCTPSQLKSWVAAGLLESSSCRVRLVLVGGEPIETELWNRLAASAHVDFHNVYGPTECTVDSTAARITQDTTAPHIGRPMLNRRVYILNARLQPVPCGVVGEIYIGGAGIARGYLNRKELTAERFIADPFSNEPRARMYKTGDLGRWRADGTIEYLGRNDHQVKIRGFRIELGEIEAQLVRHEQVKEAVVLAREDVPGEKRLVAYVVPDDPSDAPSVESLRAHLKSVLPEHMVPSAFVILERMPLTPNGKLDGRALPAPELDAYISRGYEVPQGEVEEILAGIWQSLLRVERVGRQDNFFELGGHSLLVMQVLARIDSRWSIEVPIQSIFESPMLSEFAARIEELRSSHLLDRIAAGGAEVENLLETLASMPESRAQELLQSTAMEEKS